MNADIKNTIKWFAPCWEYQQTQPQENAFLYEVPCKTWELVGDDMFFVKNKTLLYIVDHYCTFFIVKKELTVL